MYEGEAVDVAFRFVEAINRRDLAAVDRLMTADHVFVDPSGERYEGQATMREGWAEYFDRYPNYMIHIHEVYLETDIVLLAGRTTGSHLGLPRIDEFRDPVIWVARVRDSRLSEWRVVLDEDEARRQWNINPSTRLVWFRGAGSSGRFPTCCALRA